METTNETNDKHRQRGQPAAQPPRRTKTTFWLGADERAALAAIRARYGVATDADALRIALRLATTDTRGREREREREMGTEGSE